MLQDYLPYFATIIGMLIAFTNITVEIVKKIVPDDKFPTSLLAVIVALTATLVGFFAFTSYKGIPVQWYYVVGAIVTGILVSYGAMFGYDKLKEILNKLRS